MVDAYPYLFFVEAYESLMTLEAMKMQMAVQAVHAGTILGWLVKLGEQVTTGQILATMAVE